MSEERIGEYRREIDRINEKILRLLNKRAEITTRIGEIKESEGVEKFDPKRESEQFAKLTKLNRGPLSNEIIKKIFREIFRYSLSMMGEDQRKPMLVHRGDKSDTVVKVGNVEIGGGKSIIIAGPCAVENERQLDTIASFLRSLGVPIMRGGAFKPRTSPYAFQGLGIDGFRIMLDVCKRYDLLSISEVVDTHHVELAMEYIDILQIGARNMANFELLKLLGATRKPVLLKRGYMATLEEFVYAAEYIMSGGNPNLLLCERGIRTFERWTRNTLDISAVPILKQETHLPIFVDVSHSAGRKDIIPALARASLASGADGIMVEIHHNPPVALSDASQQLDFDQFQSLLKTIYPLCEDLS